MIFLPKTAVTYRTYGNTVYIIQKKHGATSVRQCAVKVGDVLDHQIMILKGVSEGDQIVISGQLRLYDGARVQLVPKVRSAP